MATTYNYGPEIADRLGARTSPASGTVNARLEGLAGFVDAIETLLTTLGANTDGLESLATALGTNTDGLEALLGDLKALLTHEGSGDDAATILDGIRDSLAGQLSVQSTSVEFEVTERSAGGAITKYTEAGVDWTIARDGSDNIVSITRDA